MNAMLRNLARLTVVLTITLTCSSTFGQATLTTDKPDYAPQSTATIYGTGFEPGEDVVVQVIDWSETGDNDTNPLHQPWTVQADSNGEFVTTWYVDENEAGLTLKAMATGSTSKAYAEVLFTDAATINISSSPAATSNALTICSGSQVTFTATFACTPGTVTKYEWKIGGVIQQTNTVTATSNSWTTTPSNGAVVSCTVTFANNSPCNGSPVTTSSITVTTVSSAPTVSTQPINKQVCVSSNTSFSTLGSGSGLGYQWQDNSSGNFVNISGATSSTLNLTAVTAAMTGRQYKCIITNACGSTQTNAATLTVNPTSVGGTVSSSQSICTGTAPADLSLTGNTGDVVKWQKSTASNFQANATSDINSTSTTLTSATIGTLTATTYIRAVVKSGECDAVNSSAVTITVSQQPSTAFAGNDPDAPTKCGVTSVRLNATNPAVGTGAWSFATNGQGDGQGTFSNTSDNRATFSGTAGGTYTLLWTVSNGTCTPSTDDVTVTFTELPSKADAGQDKIGAVTCGLTTIKLNGNLPSKGIGAWSITSGTGGSFLDPSDSKTDFSGTAGETYVLTWTVTNSPCTASSDDVTITFNINPTAPVAGPAQEISYGSTATLAANDPTIGTAAWSVITGSPSTALSQFNSTSNAAATFTPASGVGDYTLRWTTTNGVCNLTSDVIITVIPKSLTAASTIADKTYNASAATGTVTLGTVTGYVGSETLVITPSAADYANADAEDGKATTISYLLADGTNGGKAANYSMANLSSSGNIKPAALTAASTIADKNYNGSAATGTVTLGTVTGYVGSETLVITPSAADYADANVEDGKVTTISYLLANGTNGGKGANYSMANLSSSGNIKPAALTAASTIADKNYNGSAATGTVTLGTVTGYVGSETLVITPSATNYANADVEDGKTTTISYLLADGTNGGKAANYSMASLSSSGNIKPAALTAASTIADKIYNGSAATGTVTLGIVTGYVGSETLVITPSAADYADANAEDGKATTISYLLANGTNGGKAANYSMVNLSSSGNIKPVALTAASSIAPKVYDGLPATGAITVGTITGLVGNETLNITPSSTDYSNANVGTGKATTISYVLANGTNGGLATNYTMANLASSGEITPRPITVTPNALSKMFGQPDPTFTYVPSETLIAGNSFTGALSRDPGETIAGSPYAYTPGDLAAGTNYTVTLATTTNKFSIGQATSQTTLTLSGSTIRYMDNLTMTAVIKPLNAASPLTGSVEFKIGTLSYGTANVVPIPGSPDGSVQAMLITQVTNLPATYTVEAIFSGDINYSTSSNTKQLLVNPRDAAPLAGKGFYTGDVFAWTTGATSSTATVTLVAALRDENVVAKGDVRGAKVSFFFINGTSSTAIPGAQNLPVGLVDVADGSIGTASASVQLNIGSLASNSFHIGVRVTGAYVNDPLEARSECIVTVSRPLAGGFICGGGQVSGENSNGYVKANANVPSSFQFDITYTKSGTNPKGKAMILLASYNKIDGTLDSKQHTYIITTNAVSLLNVSSTLGGATGTFSAKANIVEQVKDPATGLPKLVAIEGGAAFQMVAFQQCGVQKIAITLYRKAGGVWYSNNWVATEAKTGLQALLCGKVYVDGGNLGCTPRIAGSAPVSSISLLDQPANGGLTLDLKAAPNPSKTTFTLKVQSNLTTEPISLRIYSLNGHAVEMQKNLVSGQTLEVGRQYTPGVYFAELIQGNRRKLVKLMKMPY